LGYSYDAPAGAGFEAAGASARDFVRGRIETKLRVPHSIPRHSGCTPRSMALRRTIAALIIALIPLSASAVVYVVPADDDLIEYADAIVIGTVRSMEGAFALDGGIVTNIELEVENVLKPGGELAWGWRPGRRESIRLEQPGGVVGSEAMLVSGAPQFWVGNRALLFLERTESTWRVWGMELGKFDFVQYAGRSLAIRWGMHHSVPAWTPYGHPHEERVREANRFIKHIVGRVNRTKPSWLPTDDSADDAPHLPTDLATETASAADDIYLDPDEIPIEALQTVYPPSAYTHGTFRWDVFDRAHSVIFYQSGTQPGYDSTGAAQRALAAWTNDPGSNISYIYGGTRNVGFVKDNINAIVFNSSTDVPSGALAYAQWYANATHTYKGETFYSISEGDVVIRSGISVSQKVFEEAITHELGHTLGFRHSDQGTPSSTQAVMKAVLSGQYGASLGPWDIDAARTVYTAAASAVPATVATLTATATSTSTVLVTWAPSSGATQYELERSTNIAAGFVRIATVNGTSFTDSGLAPNTTYLYRVRAINSGGASGYSPIDHATTILFTDDPLIAGVTVIKAVHLAELRTAVNAVRAAAGLSAASFTNSASPGVIVRAIHITQLRTALAEALAILGKPAVFTDPVLTAGMVIRAVHFQEIRNLVK
jgi:hypothetical protein